eukprot:jgi/Mesvir1/14491/Mv26237-RA.1
MSCQATLLRLFSRLSMRCGAGGGMRGVRAWCMPCLASIPIWHRGADVQQGWWWCMKGGIGATFTSLAAGKSIHFFDVYVASFIITSWVASLMALASYRIVMAPPAMHQTSLPTIAMMDCHGMS